MSFSSIYHQVSHFFIESPKSSLRSAAGALGISKSAVSRHRQTQCRRQQYPESAFWETKAGQHWLSRLVLASLFFFVIQRGLGVEGLSAFFRRLRLETHWGLSPSSLRPLVARIEAHLVTYKTLC